MKRLVAMAVFSFALPMFGGVIDNIGATVSCYTDGDSQTGSTSCNAADSDSGATATAGSIGPALLATAYTYGAIDATAEALVTGDVVLLVPSTLTFDLAFAQGGGGTGEEFAFGGSYISFTACQPGVLPYGIGGGIVGSDCIGTETYGPGTYLISLGAENNGYGFTYSVVSFSAAPEVPEPGTFWLCSLALIASILLFGSARKLRRN